MRIPSRADDPTPPERSPRRVRVLNTSRSGNPDFAVFRRIQNGLIFSIAVVLGYVWLLGAHPSGIVLEGLNQQASTLADAPTFGWLAVFAIVLLMLLNAMVLAAETGVELLKSVHVRASREAGNEAQALRLQDLVDHRTRYSASASFALQACRFLLFLVALTLSPGLTNSFRDRWGTLPALVVATLLVLVPILVINMIVELVPKSYASLHPHRVVLQLYGLLRACALVFAVPTRVVTGVANLLTARFGGKASMTIPNQAEEEIRTLVETAEESGEIESDEKELLHSVFEFSDTVVREIMTPRVDIDAMPVDSDPSAVIELIKESGHSRIPLYEGTDDAIVGIVHVKDLLMALLENQSPELRALMRPPLIVPENKNLHDLLQEMRLSRSQMAVVQDEFGGTSGIATIEDIVEELVGEIVDEYDVEEPEIVEDGDSYLVDAKTHLDDVNYRLGTSFESDEFDTIGGYVFGIFGRQPAEQETIVDCGTQFTVAETDGRRIMKLRIERAHASEPANQLD